MSEKTLHAVTGAFGYSGKYIAKRLLAKGREVITLTNSVGRQNPFGDQVKAFPYDFDQPERLCKTLEGVSVLYNNYWVRFNHKTFTHADAVRNSRVLFQAAKDAGVQRVVHIGIANPSLDTPLEYYSGKARLEEALLDTGLSHAILRPTVLFGKEDVLINNIAWVLRRFPIFGIFGDGEYRIQPIYVDDLAELAVEQGRSRDNAVIDAIGPETFTYKDLIRTVGQIIGKPRPIVSIPSWAGLCISKVIGMCVRDTMITKEEIDGLMADLLYVDSPPAGKTKLTDWAKEHADTLGLKYTSELARRRDRQAEYASN